MRNDICRALDVTTDSARVQPIPRRHFERFILYHGQGGAQNTAPSVLRLWGLCFVEDASLDCEDYTVAFYHSSFESEAMNSLSMKLFQV